MARQQAIERVERRPPIELDRPLEPPVLGGAALLAPALAVADVRVRLIEAAPGRGRELVPLEQHPRPAIGEVPAARRLDLDDRSEILAADAQLLRRGAKPVPRGDTPDRRR